MSLLDRLLLGGAAGCLAVAGTAAWLLIASPGGPAAGAQLPLVAATGSPTASAAGDGVAAPAPSAAGDPAEMVVDVEGGVAAPGVQRLPPGARVADAIAAAGGYGPTADLRGAARALNLAEPLRDGQQVYVPVAGEREESATGLADPEAAAAGADGTGGGLVDLNTASPEELEALPGIGPVTVQKIVAARREAPFASLEEAVERDVLNRGQLEKIADLATAG